jgi:hypothetical protein
MVLVERDEYLLELVRYIHNNPVRGGVVRRAASSPWSSHQAYLGQVEGPEWLRLGYVLQRFGRDGARARAKFDEFVDAGRKEPRRPELSGGRNASEAAQVRRALGDGHRVSDGVLGGERFVARVRGDTERVGTALSSRGSEQRAGAVSRPPLRDVVDAVLELLDLDALELEHRPKSRASSQAKRLITWLWVHEYEGTQIEVARMLRMETGAVSRHYRHALELAGDFDQQATAVVALLARRKRRRDRVRTSPTQGGLPIRYHVDVDET